jgi:hypothetical protein
MSDRREFLQRMLALVPASIIGRGFLKSKNVANAVKQIDIPIVVEPKLLSAIDYPGGWHLYETCGQSLFPLYGMSGGSCTQMMAYLMRKVPVIRNYADLAFDDRVRLGRVSGSYTEIGWECIPLEFRDLDFMAVDYDEDAVKRLINAKIAYAIKYRKPQPINMNGGNLPRVSIEERTAEAKHFGNFEIALLEEPLNRELAGHLTGVIPRLYGK